MWGRGPRGNNATCSAFSQLSVTSPTTQKQIGPFWCWFLNRWACGGPCGSLQQTLLWHWGFLPQLQPHRCLWSNVLGLYFPTLGCMVCLAPQLFLPVYPHANMGLPGPPGLPGPLPCYASSPSHVPVSAALPFWMNVSSLTPWLSDYHTVQFSGSSDYFLFLNLLLFLFGCARRQSVSTYASILTGSHLNNIIKKTVQLVWIKLNNWMVKQAGYNIFTCVLFWYSNNYK